MERSIRVNYTTRTMRLTRNRLEEEKTQEQVIDQIRMGLDSKGSGAFELVDLSFKARSLETEGYS